MHAQLQSPLLQLPAELQLAIFEYAVQEAEPLLVNCGCDSNYEDNKDKWIEDKAAWEEGQYRPPEQPSLTRTCALIRAITLPMFYRMNGFRAHYCFQADKQVAIKWLDRVGPENRRMMRDFCFQDLNPQFDEWLGRDLLQLKRGDVIKKMGGRLETLKVEGRCCHRVTFPAAMEDDLDGVEELFAA